jgi:hypothetical protein
MRYRDRKPWAYGRTEGKTPVPIRVENALGGVELFVYDYLDSAADAESAVQSAAARPRVRLGLPVAHAPVLRFAEGRFAGVIATTVYQVALVVVVAH